jgi:hypothetical protein
LVAYFFVPIEVNNQLQMEQVNNPELQTQNSGESKMLEIDRANESAPIFIKHFHALLFLLILQTN